MGSVARRLVLVLAALALVVPGPGRASSSTAYAPPYQLGPAGGDGFNTISRDTATGDLSVIRVNPAGATTGLGCGGSGGFASFEIAHVATQPIKTLTVHYSEALVDPYTFVSISIYQDDHYVDTEVVRGPVLLEGQVVLRPATPATGALKIWFGIQVSSACPNIDGGRAIFDSVTIEE